MSPEFAFSSESDWSTILAPYIKTLFKESGLCYFGHVIYDEYNQPNWMMTNSLWAELYWLGGLYENEPIYQDIQKLTLKNHNCIALWDSYNTSDNDYQQEIMQRRMDVCKMRKGITIGKQVGNKKHYMSLGWKEMKSCETSFSTALSLQKFVDPIRILHTQLVAEQRLKPLENFSKK